MRYILDSSGYIEEVSCNLIECNNKGCTEYTGSVPSGYSSLQQWAATANIRAYKITNGNLVYDSARDAALQTKWEKTQANTTKIWEGNHYAIGENNTQYFNKTMEVGRLYIIVVQGLSGSYRMSFSYIHGTGNEMQHGYYDGTTVVRWRIVINGDGTGFFLHDASMSIGSNAGVRAIYEVN